MYGANTTTTAGGATMLAATGFSGSALLMAVAFLVAGITLVALSRRPGKNKP